MARRRPTKPARPAAHPAAAPPRALLDPGRGLDARALELRRAAEAQRVRRAIATYRPELGRPAAPDPASPFLVVPVTRVRHNATDSVLVVAWDLEVWLPKSAMNHPDPDAILEGWAGSLEISSRWAAGVGLPPTRRRA